MQQVENNQKGLESGQKGHREKKWLKKFQSKIDKYEQLRLNLEQCGAQNIYEHNEDPDLPSLHISPREEKRRSVNFKTLSHFVNATIRKKDVYETTEAIAAAEASAPKNLPKQNSLPSSPRSYQLRPEVINRYIDRLTEIGIEVEGIFRVSADEIVIHRICTLFCEDGRESSSPSAHEVANALKLYLRESTEPLLTFCLFDDFVSCSGTREEQVQQIKNTVGKLPYDHQQMLHSLMRFLMLVSDKASVNKMNVDNLAMLFGPAILRTKANEINDFNEQIQKKKAVTGAKALTLEEVQKLTLLMNKEKLLMSKTKLVVSLLLTHLEEIFNGIDLTKPRNGVQHSIENITSLADSGFSFPPTPPNSPFENEWIRASHSRVPEVRVEESLPYSNTTTTTSTTVSGVMNNEIKINRNRQGYKESKELHSSKETKETPKQTGESRERPKQSGFMTIKMPKVSPRILNFKSATLNPKKMRKKSLSCNDLNAVHRPLQASEAPKG